MSTYQILV